MRGPVTLALALVVALLVEAPARARGTCTVEGRAVQPFVMTIAPREAAPFKLRVSGGAATITPGGLGAPALARVKGPLVFEGAVATADIPARTRRMTDALNGLLRLAPATEQLTLHANVRASIVDAEVRIGGVTFRGLALPCNALTLDAVAEPPAALVHDNPDAARFVAAGKLLHFRGGPGAGVAMEAVLDGPEALELRETESSGAWVQVTSQWPDGTLLTAWVKRDELRPAGMAHESLDRGPNAPVSCGGRERASGNEVGRTVVAEVKAGTPVFAARYLGSWAKVAAGTKLTVRYFSKDDWIQIVQVPHLSGASDEDACEHPLDSAWIARTAAALPAEPPAPAAPAGAPPANAAPVGAAPAGAAPVAAGAVAAAPAKAAAATAKAAAATAKAAAATANPPVATATKNPASPPASSAPTTPAGGTAGAKPAAPHK
jgi:hypothetical protein